MRIRTIMIPVCLMAAWSFSSWGEEIATKGVTASLDRQDHAEMMRTHHVKQRDLEATLRQHVQEGNEEGIEQATQLMAEETKKFLADLQELRKKAQAAFNASALASEATNEIEVPALPARLSAVEEKLTFINQTSPWAVTPNAEGAELQQAIIAWQKMTQVHWKELHALRSRPQEMTLAERIREGAQGIQDAEEKVIQIQIARIIAASSPEQLKTLSRNRESAFSKLMKRQQEARKRQLEEIFSEQTKEIEEPLNSQE